jgi:hypothetical protein
MDYLLLGPDICRIAAAASTAKMEAVLSAQGRLARSAGSTMGARSTSGPSILNIIGFGVLSWSDVDQQLLRTPPIS